MTYALSGHLRSGAVDRTRVWRYPRLVITELRVSNWRCLKDVTLALTPLHALIGPNDSGKSTLLEALRSAVLLTRPDVPDTSFEIRGHGLIITLSADGASIQGAPSVKTARARLGTPRRLRLNPDEMRRPSALISGDDIVFNERGYELPGVYDAILSRNREAWDTIEASVRSGFPTVRRLALKAVSQSQKVLEIELLDGTRVPADQMSEGLLYWLAFSVLPHVSPTKLLLLEEPENGLHPARIAEVVKVLRQVADSGTQVVLATHSPLLVNELRPEEVTVVTRTPAEGTRVRRASQLPDLERLLTVFSLGELWLAFADGKEEAGLFEARPDPDPEARPAPEPT